MNAIQITLKAFQDDKFECSESVRALSESFVDVFERLQLALVVSDPPLRLSHIFANIYDT